MSASGRRRLAAPALACAVLLGVGAVSAHRGGVEARAAEVSRRHRPVEHRAEGYASSRECRACHPEQYASWHDSYHRSMTRVASPETVFGDFDDVELGHLGATWKLSTDGRGFFAELPEHERAGGERRRRIALVTGSHHLQVYWYETGEGRKVAPLPFAYLRADARWIPRRAAFLRPPSPERPGEEGRWNDTCITCHTTHGQPRLADGAPDTRVAELGIACEACHGPAAGHVRANRSPLTRYLRHLTGGDEAEQVVDPRALPHDRASQICGQCHGNWQFRTPADFEHWRRQGFAYRPGGDPNATQVLFAPSLRAQEPVVERILRDVPALAVGTFWSDGMTRVSGREFNGLYESPCYQRGEASCLSCHRMHQDPKDARARGVWANDQLERDMDGDRACLQCHARFERELAAHTHHAADSPGSRCYNCHMPNTSYGLLKAMRTHQVSSPDIATELATGRPNACNLCHLDRTLAWTAGALEARYGTAAPALDAVQAQVAAGVRYALMGDAGQRALVAWHFGWGPARQASGDAWMLPYLSVLLDDPYDAVRYIAGRSLRRLPGQSGFEYDFVPAPSSREPASPRALARWHPPRAPRPELLLGPTGLDHDRAQALLDRRDHRPVHLFE